MSIKLTSLGDLVTEPGTNIVHCAPGFGARIDDSAYYDPAGAVVGEACVLVIDSAGRKYLVPTGIPFRLGDVRDQLTLPVEIDAGSLGLVEGDAQPVTIHAPQTGEIIEKDGTTVTLTAASLPGAVRVQLSLPLTADRAVLDLPDGDRQPVEMRPPVTGPVIEKDGIRVTLTRVRAPLVRDGRPVTLAAPTTAAVRPKDGMRHTAPVSSPVVPRDGHPVGQAASQHFHCGRCGAEIPVRGRCGACQAQSDLQKVKRLRAQGNTTIEIARATGFSEPQVKHLIARLRRGGHR